MDDEEYSYAALQEPLYRVETGYYEYRLILRCRQLARQKFSKSRQDVLVKLELLDQETIYKFLFLKFFFFYIQVGVYINKNKFYNIGSRKNRK